MRNKKNIIFLVLMIIILIGISIGAFFILKGLGVTNVASLREIINKTGIFGWLVFLILQIIVTTLLCVVPGTTMTFIISGVIIFGVWEAILICSIGVFISSTVMFFVGDKLGEKVAIKMVGEENLQKAQEVISVKSKIMLPLMLLFPMFPDDALCLVAGMTKMKYRYFAIIIAVFRTIGVVSMCLTSYFGITIIDWSTLTLIDWAVVINLAIFDMFVIWKTILWIERKYLSKMKSTQAPEIEE